MEGNARCRKCLENVQVDRLLQTPKDEITHFGVWRALQLQREAEVLLLLACHKYGLWERMVLQRILEFSRVPFITTHSGMHFCELCNKAFAEMSTMQGDHVHMSCSHMQKLDWEDCPGPRLAFNIGECFRVAELLKAPSGRWYFRTLAAPPKPPTADEQRPSSNVDEQSDVLTEAMIGVRGRSRGTSRTCTGYVATVATTFESYWAPLDATVEGMQSSPLAQHLQEQVHRDHEAAVSMGRTLLVSRAAVELAGKLGERPTTSLSRFQAGLGLGRFCEPAHMEAAGRLERVRDLSIPVKFLREVFPQKKDFLWITPEECREAEDRYEERSRRNHRKGS